MKRKVALLAGAAALGVAVFVGSQLSAQNQPAAQPLRTRVGLVNLPHVIKSYQKYIAFEREWQQSYQAYEKEFDGKRRLLVQYQEEMQKATEQVRKDQVENQARVLQREMQDKGEEAKKVLSKKRDDQAVIIYREIETAVQAFARANDLELVMTYNDAVVSADLLSPGNIQRKLQIGALMPMYSATNMDITQWIVQMLNQAFGQNGGAAAGGAAPAAPRGNQ